MGSLAQLLSSLEAAGVKISAALPVAEKQNWLLWFLTNFGPLVLYIFLFRYLLSTMAECAPRRPFPPRTLHRVVYLSSRAWR